MPGGDDLSGADICGSAPRTKAIQCGPDQPDTHLNQGKLRPLTLTRADIS